MSRQRRPQSLNVRSPDVGVVVSVMPTSATSLQHEVELVKAGLLYGDDITVVSPLASMLRKVSNVDGWSADNQIELFQRVGPDLGLDTSGFHLLGTLLHKRHRSPQEIIAVTKMNRIMSSMWPEIRDATYEIMEDDSFVELNTAIDSGLVTVRDVSPAGTVDLVEWCLRSAVNDQQGLPQDEGYTSLFIRGFVDQLAIQLEGEGGYLMVDNGIANLMTTMVSEGIVSITSRTTSRTSEALAASGLLGRLPSFPGATVAEILDIRTALAKPVSHFRREMAALSRDFESSGFDEGFDDEVQGAWEGKVVPALLDIDAAIEDNNIGKWIVSKTVGAGTVPGLGIVTYGLSTGHHLVDAIGAATATAGPMLQALFQQRVEDKNIRTRPFYFLHTTEQLLGG